MAIILKTVMSLYLSENINDFWYTEQIWDYTTTVVCPEDKIFKTQHADGHYIGNSILPYAVVGYPIFSRPYFVRSR